MPLQVRGTESPAAAELWRFWLDVPGGGRDAYGTGRFRRPIRDSVQWKDYWRTLYHSMRSICTLNACF